MKFPSLLPLLPILATAYAHGNIIISNECDANLYLRSPLSTPESEPLIIKQHSSYSQAYHNCTSHNTLFLSLSPSFPANESTEGEDEVGMTFSARLQTQPQTQAAYTAVYWTLSAPPRHAFLGRTVAVTPSDSTCESVTWGAGLAPQGKGSKDGEEESCSGDSDLVLSVCTGECLPAGSPCGARVPREKRVCCTHCIGEHHCVAVEDM